MLAVDKWGDDGDAHVKRLARSASQRCRDETEFSQAWVDCITGKSEEECVRYECRPRETLYQTAVKRLSPAREAAPSGKTFSYGLQVIYKSPSRATSDNLLSATPTRMRPFQSLANT